MPNRRAVAGASVLVLTTLILATVANLIAVSNAYQVRKQCSRIATHSDRTRDILNESLTPLKNGDLDDDYRRIFGPNAQDRKQQAIDRLERQISQFKSIDCTPIIIQWIRGH